MPQQPSNCRITAYTAVLVSVQWSQPATCVPPGASPPLQPIPLGHRRAMGWDPRAVRVPQVLHLHMALDTCQPTLSPSGKQVLGINTCVQHLERWYRWVRLQEQRRRCREQTCGHRGGRTAAFDRWCFSPVRWKLSGLISGHCLIYHEFPFQ